MSTLPPAPPAAPSQTSLRSINCTRCAAPLIIHGGHKILSITCSYCGSELDAKHEYEVLYQFTNRDRPITPIELGMSGKFKGIEFTVIGLIQFRSSDGYGWIEFALFSPTHGYAWLEQVENHFVFARRTRDIPSTPMGGQVKSTFKVGDRTYRIFEKFRASIIYVEGELTFVARAGDAVDITEAICPPFVYSRERSKNEEEFVIGEYLEPAAVYDALDLKDEPGERHTVHPAQPYDPSALVEGLARAGKYFTPLAAGFLILVLVLGWGSTLLVARFDANVYAKGSQSKSFTVQNADALLELQMNAPLNNAWAQFDIQVQKAGKAVFSMAKQIAYYSGYEGGEHWSEGSQSASAYFKVPEPGEYNLVIRGQGGAGSRGRAPHTSNLVVTVKEGIIVSRYFLVLSFLFGFAFLLQYITRWRFESKRWGDADDD